MIQCFFVAEEQNLGYSIRLTLNLSLFCTWLHYTDAFYEFQFVITFIFTMSIV